MRHYVIASHGGFSKGIYESIKTELWKKFHLQMKSLYVLMSLEAASTRNL